MVIATAKSQIDNQVFSEHDVMASIVRESFFEFVQEFWHVIIPREPVWNWHIEYLCDELQYIAERIFAGKKKEYDLIINISPGETKSTIASIMLPAWMWTKMPIAQFITASYAFLLASDLSRRSRDVVSCDKYKMAFPEVVLRHDQNVKTNYMNTTGGFRVAVGTGGVTGFHGHLIIVDDPLNPNEAISEAELKAANTWMSETLSQRKVDKAETPTILIMQRLHQDDPTANMIKQAKEAQLQAIQEGDEDAPLKLKHICLPAEITTKIRPAKLRRHYKNGLMDPKRLPRSVLIDNKASLGEFGFAGQFLQNPVPLGGGMFKTGRIIIGEPPRKWLRLVRFWDKAGSAGRGAWTVGVLLGKARDDTPPRYWVLDVIRGRWGSDVREATIKQTAILDGKEVIIGVEQEPGSGGKQSAEMTAKMLAGWIVRIDIPTGDKALRAEPFSVQVNNGNVSMRLAEWNDIYINELRFFPHSKFKDQVDSSSGGFNLLEKAPRRVGGLW